MGKYVDEIVAYKIKEEFEKIEKEIANEETKKLVYDTLFNEPKVKIYNEITEEITPDLEKEISKNLEEKFKIEKNKKIANEIRNLLITGVIISFLIGVSVNQFSNLITNYNSMVVMLVCFLLIAFIFWYKVHKLVIEMTKEN